MAVPPIRVEAPALVPTKFGLLDTIPAKGGPSQVGFGVEYQSAFCGPARPFSPACDPADLGSISVSVDIASIATITSTGLPDGTYRIVWGDGQETPSEAEQLNEAHDYSATTGDGTYVVQVYDNAGGSYSEVTITVQDGVASGPFASDTIETKIADDGITTVTGEVIPIYHLFQCRMIAGAEDGEARARESLDLGASRAVEEGFQTVFATGATDITPGGTAVSLVDGLARLEQYAGQVYGGRPVIHMTRANALRLISLMAVYVVGDHLETALGSLVIAGAGYGGLSQPSAPAATAGWIYATGAVTIWEGKSTFSPVTPKNPYDNEFITLAERTYTPTYECFHAAVEVTEQVTA